MTTIQMETTKTRRIRNAQTAVVATKTRRTRNASKCDVASKKIKLSKMENIFDDKSSSRYLMPVHNVHCVPFPKEGNPQGTPEVSCESTEHL